MAYQTAKKRKDVADYFHEMNMKAQGHGQDRARKKLTKEELRRRIRYQVKQRYKDEEWD